MEGYRNKIIRFLLGLFLVSFVLYGLTTDSLAATFNVSTASQLRNALQTAQSNLQADTINIAAGTYSTGGTPFGYSAASTENFTITIVGGGPTVTILNGGQNDRVLSVSTSSVSSGGPKAHIVIRNLTIRDGRTGITGVGLTAHTINANITVSNCQFRNNHTVPPSGDALGGGAFLQTFSGTITLSKSTFDNNSAATTSPRALGGGAFVQVLTSGSATLTLNTFTNNSADSLEASGGGAFVDAIQGTITLNNNTFTDNFAESKGGGVLVSTSSGNITLTGNIYTNNSIVTSSEDAFGGGVFVETDSGNVTIASNAFSNNSVDVDATVFTDDSADASTDGGGAFVETGSGNITISDSRFTGNSADSFNGPASGGGAFAKTNSGTITLIRNTFTDNFSDQGGGGAGVFTFSSGAVALNNNTFTNNFSEIGGGASVSSGTSVTLNNNTFIDNFGAFRGGGAIVSLQEGSITLINNTFFNNSGFDSNGSGGGADVSLSGEGNIRLTNNTFTSNSAAVGGGLRVALGDAATADIFNNIIFANTATNQGDDIFVRDDLGDNNGIGSPLNLFNNDFSEFSCSGFCTTNIIQEDNINADPFFVDPLNGNVHLGTNSPAINGGSPTAPALPATDFEGNPRVFDSLPDIGADEALTCDGQFPTIIGTLNGELIDGTTGPDVILGFGGADTINGFGGEDRICGGDDSDTIVGGGGVDRLFGERGNDTIRGGAGNDQLFGGPNDDTLNGGDNTDTCDFGGGQVSGTATNCETVTDTMSGFSGLWAGDVTQTCEESVEDLICRIEGTLEVENPGVDTAEQSILRFFLSFDELLDEEDVLIQETLVDPLEPQEIVEVNLQEQLPPNQDAIGQFIIALLDATDVVSEINEENNVVVSSAIVGQSGGRGGGCALVAEPVQAETSWVNALIVLLVPLLAIGFRFIKRRHKQL